MFNLELILDTRRCLISAGRGILRQAELLVENMPPSSGCLLVTDRNVARYWGDQLFKSLQQLVESSCEMVVLEPGERHKNLQAVEQIYHRLHELEYDRDCLLVALGGGVVGDITGFAAATWMRGVRYLQLPTTLLAMVDAGLGGKTGVNLRRGKNLVGSFHQPLAVLVDPDLLQTLPSRHYTNALPEIIKYGSVLDGALFGLVEQELPRLQEWDSTELMDVITRCLILKAGVVTRDEREQEERMLLNFGHTLGHALEQCSQVELLHGEAVAGGMLVAAAISRRLEILSQTAAQRLMALINALPLPPLPPVEPEQLLRAIRQDKKRRAGVQPWVLLEGIGGGMIHREVPEQVVVDSIKEILS